MSATRIPFEGGKYTLVLDASEAWGVERDDGAFLEGGPAGLEPMRALARELVALRNIADAAIDTVEGKQGLRDLGRAIHDARAICDFEANLANPGVLG